MPSLQISKRHLSMWSATPWIPLSQLHLRCSRRLEPMMRRDSLEWPHLTLLGQRLSMLEKLKLTLLVCIVVISIFDLLLFHCIKPSIHVKFLFTTKNLVHCSRCQCPCCWWSCWRNYPPVIFPSNLSFLLFYLGYLKLCLRWLIKKDELHLVTLLFLVLLLSLNVAIGHSKCKFVKWRHSGTYQAYPRWWHWSCGGQGWKGFSHPLDGVCSYSNLSFTYLSFTDFMKVSLFGGKNFLVLTRNTCVRVFP